MYGPEFKIGKVGQTDRKYRTKSGRPWGPVEYVKVFGVKGWFPINLIKVVGPKLAKRQRSLENNLY